MTSQNEEWYKAQEEMRNKLEDEWGDFIEDVKEDEGAERSIRRVYGRRMSKARLALLQANPDKPYVIWHYGVSGSGKTRTVCALAPNAVFVDGGYKNGRIDGYNGEEEVIWDQFYPSELAYSKLVKLLDHGMQFVKVRRGHVKWRAKTVWFTSISSPESMYPKPKRLLEMIDEIYYWKSKDEWIKIK
jgi:hypothetical protein